MFCLIGALGLYYFAWWFIIILTLVRRILPFARQIRISRNYHCISYDALQWKYAYIQSFFTRGQFRPSGIVVAFICVYVCVCACESVCQSLACPRDNSGPVQAKITKFGTKVERLTLTCMVKFNSKVQIYPILSLWVCLRDKSPPIKVIISKFRQKWILALLRSLLIFALINLVFSFIFNLKPVFLPNIASLIQLCHLVYIWWDYCQWVMHIPHGSAHILIVMHTERVPPWTVKQSCFISLWDHWGSASLDSATVLDFTSFYRFLPYHTHFTCQNLYGNIRQSPKQQ